MDRNFHADLKQSYLDWKLKFVKCPRYETYNNKEDKKEQQEETKDTGEGSHTLRKDDDMDEEGEPPVLLVTQVNNILHSIYSNVEVYINNQQKYNSMCCLRTSLTPLTTWESHLSMQRTFTLRGFRLWKVSRWDYGSTLVGTFSYK